MNRRRGLGILLIVLLFASLTLANPRNMKFNATADEVFKAAKKAAAGHRIVFEQDDGLKTLTESGEEVQSFKFATSLPGVTFRVIEVISVEPLPEGASKLEVWFYKDRGSSAYVPSASYELREAQLKQKLQSKMAALEEEKENYETQYEVSHTIDLETYVSKKKEIRHLEADATIEELEQEREAATADLAEMPTSSFPTMDAAADKFFSLVRQNLQASQREGRGGADQ